MGCYLGSRDCFYTFFRHWFVFSLSFCFFLFLFLFFNTFSFPLSSLFSLPLSIGVQTPAFFVRLSADLPTPMNAIYSDNYITLLPGDEVSVSIIVKSFPSSSLSSSSSVLGERVDELVVEVSGWNVGDFSFTVEFSE